MRKIITDISSERPTRSDGARRGGTVRGTSHSPVASCVAAPALYTRLSFPYSMPTNESSSGAVALVRRWWRALLAETVATALLVLLGVASLLPIDGQPAPLTHPAFAFGIVVLANVEAFGPVSGAHMNPAVTLAAVLDQRLGALPGLCYVVAQLLGSTLGFAALMGLAPSAFAGAHDVVGGNEPGSVGTVAAAGVEALLTGVLALLCCGVWSAHEQGQRDHTVPIKFGLTITGLVYAGGVMSSASLNPARSFGPALLQRFRSDHWVYWVGPLGGSALATLLHRYVLRAPAPRAARDPDALPLREKHADNNA